MLTLKCYNSKLAKHLSSCDECEMWWNINVGLSLVSAATKWLTKTVLSKIITINQTQIHFCFSALTASHALSEESATAAKCLSNMLFCWTNQKIRHWGKHRAGFLQQSRSPSGSALSHFTEDWKVVLVQHHCHICASGLWSRGLLCLFLSRTLETC